MTTGARIWQVAVHSPLHQEFDYLPPTDVAPDLAVEGLRVRVPFGRGTRVGIITGTAAASRIDAKRLKTGPRTHRYPTDPFPGCIPPAAVGGGLLSLSSGRGIDRRAACPAAARRQRDRANAAALAPDHSRSCLRAGFTAPRTAARVADAKTDRGSARHIRAGVARRFRRARRVAHAARKRPGGKFRACRGRCRTVQASIAATLETGPALNDSQRAATTAIEAALGRFQPFLLDGVTGSGKTEVYFHAIEGALRTGRQTLLLVPEIGLTPQMVERVRRRFSVPLAVLHSGLSDGERLAAWRAAAEGRAPIVIGTRSAVFVPLERPGIIIVDEEHDASYKQQDGFRYHARDLAVVRAQYLKIPVVLGSATPALESLHNCRQDRYQHLILAMRAGTATPPEIRLVSLREQAAEHGISPVLARAIERHLASDHQVLLFLNRRGYAPTLLCHDCGWVADCSRCDAHMIYHRARHLLRCHHCNAERPVPAGCPTCGSPDLRPLGQGTEQAEEVLAERFPAAEIVRIDRDSTRRKGSLDALFQRVKAAARSCSAHRC